MATITLYNDLGEQNLVRTYKRTVLGNVRVSNADDGIRVVIGQNYQGGVYKEPHVFTAHPNEFTLKVGDRIFVGVLGFNLPDVQAVEQDVQLYKVTSVKPTYQLNGEIGFWDIEAQ